MLRPICTNLAALTLLAACEESEPTAPSPVGDVYALARIGLVPPPIPLGQNGGAPFLIADTLKLTDERPRKDAGRILSRVMIFQEGSGTRDRTETRFGYVVEGGTLTIDTCPIGSMCIAALVYQPMVFQITGDSLYQIVPFASPIQMGAVYGRVRRR